MRLMERVAGLVLMGCVLVGCGGDKDEAVVEEAGAGPVVVSEVDYAELPAISDADWAMYNHDVAGWRFNSGETVLNAENAAGLVEKWRFPMEGSSDRIGAVHGTPTVVNGYVYFGTATFPAFYKLRPDGTVAWVHDLGTGRASVGSLPEGGRNLINAANGVLTSALVTDRGVYFGDSAGVFYCLDRLTGEERWKVDTRDESFEGHHQANLFNASAILVDGKVIVGGGAYEHAHPLDPSYRCCVGRGFVLAFDPESGDVIWKYDVGEEPVWFDEPVVIEDAKGRHVFYGGPSTSSVWSTPSYDAASGTIFFGTDVHNSPRKPTADDPRYHSEYTAAVIAVDVETGAEKWVTQFNDGDIFNHTMSGYDPNTERYKDTSVGDTPKVYELEIDGESTTVVGVGCKNGGFYVMRADTGEIVASTPVYGGPPVRPLDPEPDARMIALPSTIGGIQTGVATDGERVYTNGIDWLSLNTNSPGWPEGGRVVSVSLGLEQEFWRHERAQVLAPGYRGGDPVAAGVAVANGVVCFAPAVSELLVVLNAETGEVLKELPIGTVWSGPSVSRGRVYIGTGSILFLKRDVRGHVYSFGLPGEDEVDAMGSGNE